MKIAIDVTPVISDGRNGGVKQLVLELLRGFAESEDSDEYLLLTTERNIDLFRDFEKFGFQAACVVPGVKSRSREFKGFVHQIFQKLSPAKNSRYILRKNGVHILFCPFGATTYRERGIPTVSVIVDLQHLYFPFFFSKRELANRRNFYERIGKESDHIVTISNFTRNTVINKLKIEPSRISTIPISIQSRLKLKKNGHSQEVLIQNNLKGKKYAFYPANFWPHKNHRILLIAFGMYLKQNPDSDLHLVFTGEEMECRNWIRESIHQMGIGHHVRTLGFLNDDELAVVWRHCHFLIFPSLFEGFGIPLVEAMFFRKPILASDVCSIPEVAEDAAIYFDPRRPDDIVHALGRIMSDEGLYHQLVKHGQDQIKKYKRSRMISGYQRILSRLGSKMA